MKAIPRDWNWWAYFFRVRHRQQIAGIAAWDAQLVEFVIYVLDLRPGQRVLDLACGSGVHARLLARRGLDVVGLDIAPSLVEYATQRAAEEGLDKARFVQGDMRAPGFRDEFDAVTILGTSFGFFDEAGNRQVLRAIANALVSGGRFLLDLTDLRSRLLEHQRRWIRMDDGILLMEHRFDPTTQVLHSDFAYVDPDGALNVYQEQGVLRRELVRIYSLPELKAMLADAGLEFLAAYGEQTLPPVPYSEKTTEWMIVVGKKPAS